MQVLLLVLQQQQQQNNYNCYFIIVLKKIIKIMPPIFLGIPSSNIYEPEHQCFVATSNCLDVILILNSSFYLILIVNFNFNFNFNC
jgi:hypothetical protein